MLKTQAMQAITKAALSCQVFRVKHGLNTNENNMHKLQENTQRPRQLSDAQKKGSGQNDSSWLMQTVKHGSDNNYTQEHQGKTEVWCVYTCTTSQCIQRQVQGVFGRS